MSGLLYICDYGNESESDDCVIDNDLQALKKSKLPAPDLSNIPAVLSDQYFDNPEHHKGRIRRFPHVRGNWATFVYVTYSDEEALLKLTNKLKTLMFNINNSCHICDDFHLSLSKTVVLNYHTIGPFSQSLKEALSDIESFYLGLDTIEVLCNEEKSRTFIVLKADYFSKRSLSTILNKVDSVLGEFKLEKFYHDPSFHISLLWTKGDQKLKFEGILQNLNNIISQEVEKTLKSVLINKVNCKSGNKFFQYSLE